MLKAINERKWLSVLQGMAAVLLIAVIPCVAFGAGKPISKKSSAKPPVKREVRPPAVAGQWYPAGRDTLAQMVDGFMDAAKGVPKVKGRLIGLVSPHAGFVFSGPVAAFGYRLLAESGQKVGTVILIGPSHRFPLDGVSVNNVQDYETPLGVIQNDRKLANEVIKASDGEFRYIPEAHAREHSLEAQLPFLQRALKEDFKIVPILVNYPAFSGRLASILAKVISRRKDVIIVASSDMSHYHPYDEARRMDLQTFDILKRLDVKALEQRVSGRETYLCGGAAVLTLAEIAKSLGAKSMMGLKYLNSGDTSGHKEAVVGYCSVVVSIPRGKIKQENRSISMNEQLNDSEKKELLSIARQTIKEYVRYHRIPKVEVRSEKLKMRRGAFVTIKRHGSLRGCIGRFSPVSEPLYRIVQEMAVAAATQDPRFPPMSVSETEDMQIEISVLSDLSRIKSIDEIQVGVHGLEIEKGMFRGVLLPQVATEYGWDKTTFLEQTCRKAGLPSDAYKKGATIYVFTAQVFGDED